MVLVPRKPVGEVTPSHDPTGAPEDGGHREEGPDIRPGEVGQEVQATVVSPREASRVPV